MQNYYDAYEKSSLKEKRKGIRSHDKRIISRRKEKIICSAKEKADNKVRSY
jgi:hypothetical protein